MKNILLSILLFTFSLPVISQGLVYINGIVTDNQTGLPISDHPVTIMTDSTFGIFYYNMVYTDSSGYYYDDIPMIPDSSGNIYVWLYDCNNLIHQVVITYNPGIQIYTRDFQICGINSLPCDAFFSFYDTGNMIYQFIDQSIGDPLMWLWDFGDGTFSQEQNPFHSFPGPGIFNTCLTITSNNCTDTFCNTIVISDTVYRQIYGQVFAGNFPVQQGRVTLFSMNPNGTFLPLGEDCPLDSNGIYFFTLVPQGAFFIQAVPGDSTGYLPTYYGDVTNWQSAAQTVLGEPENPYNIDLVAVPAGSAFFGPGSIKGQIENIGLNRALADHVNMILLDENIMAIGFAKVSSSGLFEFPSLDYGTYHLRAELAGAASDNMKFEISPEKPHLEVFMNYTGNSVLGLQDQEPGEGSFSVYPNPVADRLHFSVSLPSDADIIVELYSMTGNIVYKNQETVSTGKMISEINVNGFSTGIYTLKVTSDNGMVFSRKVVIVR